MGAFTQSVNLLGSGGGGSSDFSVAKVTIHNHNEDVFGFAIPVISEDTQIISVLMSMFMDGSTFDIALYKDACVAALLGDVDNVTVSGSIDYDEEDGVFIITGDGSIDFNNEIH